MPHCVVRTVEQVINGESFTSIRIINVITFRIQKVTPSVLSSGCNMGRKKARGRRKRLRKRLEASRNGRNRSRGTRARKSNKRVLWGRFV